MSSERSQSPPAAAGSLSASRLGKQIGDDVEHLSHRISKLKIEEMMLQGSIEALERQTARVLQKREEASREAALRERRSSRRQAERETKVARAAELKKQTEEAVNQAKQRAFQERREAVMEQRRIKEILECEQHIRAAESREHIQDLHKSIRESELQHKDRWDRAAARKTQYVRDERDREMELAAAERDEKLRLLQRLIAAEEKAQARVEEARLAKKESADRLESARGSARLGTSQGSRLGTSQGSRSASSDPGHLPAIQQKSSRPPPASDP